MCPAIDILSLLTAMRLRVVSIIVVMLVLASPALVVCGCTETNTLGNRTATIETSKGIIQIELYEQRAPITTANFIKLAKSGFYDGLIFHRVINDFVIQTGDPTGTGLGGSDDTIVLEIHKELTHTDGAVGMARGSNPNSATSQFYICDGPQHDLDGHYAVFGQVINGMDVVRAIAEVPTDANDKPLEDVIVTKVWVSQLAVVKHLE